MADFGRWRDDAAGEPAAGTTVDTDRTDRADQSDRPDRADQPDRAERGSPDATRPGLRDLYTDDPDDIFDPDGDPGTADPDQDPADAPDDELGNRPHGEPPPDGPDRDQPQADDSGTPQTLDVDSPIWMVDRPQTPADKNLTYGTDLTLREGRLVRPPLFDGPPTREQAVQGDLSDCGVIAALGAVAGRRPEAIRDLVSQRPDGGYLVRLHQVEPDERGVFVPTGERIELAVTPELPVRNVMPYRAAFADTYWTGVSWSAVLEKALAGVDSTWPDERLARYGTSGYDRLNLGTHSWDRAELLAMLTGEPAADVLLDTRPGGELAVERWLRERLDRREPVLVGTTAGDDEGELPGDLVRLHAYEVVGVGDGLVRLHNPWGTNHPEPLTVRTLVDAITPSVATLWDREMLWDREQR